jgi:hypothetical protein
MVIRTYTWSQEFENLRDISIHLLMMVGKALLMKKPSPYRSVR